MGRRNFPWEGGRSASADLLLLDHLAGKGPPLEVIRAAYEEAGRRHRPIHQEWRSVVEQCRMLGILAEDPALEALWVGEATGSFAGAGTGSIMLRIATATGES